MAVCRAALGRRCCVPEAPGAAVSGGGSSSAALTSTPWWLRCSARGIAAAPVGSRSLQQYADFRQISLE